MSNYKSFKAFEKAFSKKSKKIMKELADTLPEAGDMMIKTIKKRTRLGYGVDKNHASKERLEKLSDAYKKQRKRMPDLSSETTPKKSNLTRKGGMLDSLKADVSKRKLTVTVSPSGRQDGDKISNKKKAEYVSKLRPFLFLSKPEVKRLKALFRKQLDEIIKKLF